ncbi:hypothetical protein [Levilactobacillus sp. N40-8-2]|uniref:hypothetical protein n=1 Tax=Levilactobacillus muriae TaxID=3238987 RepID=UPI0038B2664A
MKRILIAGPLDVTSQAFVRQLNENTALDLTVYTPSDVALPAGITGFTGEVLDEGGLSAVMLDQDMVVALAPTIHLTEIVQTVITAAQAVAVPRVLVLVSRTDDIEDLPGELRTAQRTLLASGIESDLFEGLGSVSAMLGVAPIVAEAVPLLDERFAG